MEEEIWRDIPIDKYKGRYMISNFGDVKSLAKTWIGHNGCVRTKGDSILRKLQTGKGYHSVILFLNGESKQFKVHRLVATAFIPNPNNLPQVNHKDGDKTNNHVSNLEWCTQSENMTHAFNTGLNAPLKGKHHYSARRVIDTRTGIIYDWSGDAADSIGIKRGYLVAMLNGHFKNKTTMRYYNGKIPK